MLDDPKPGGLTGRVAVDLRLVAVDLRWIVHQTTPNTGELIFVITSVFGLFSCSSVVFAETKTIGASGLNTVLAPEYLAVDRLRRSRYYAAPMDVLQSRVVTLHHGSQVKTCFTFLGNYWNEERFRGRFGEDRGRLSLADVLATIGDRQLLREEALRIDPGGAAALTPDDELLKA